jgi:hypothetical protein
LFSIKNCRMRGMTCRASGPTACGPTGTSLQPKKRCPSSAVIRSKAPSQPGPSSSPNSKSVRLRTPRPVATRCPKRHTPCARTRPGPAAGCHPRLWSRDRSRWRHDGRGCGGLLIPLRRSLGYAARLPAPRPEPASIVSTSGVVEASCRRHGHHSPNKQG